jgi:predicted AlkP superfamily pyrophosphatase or phosphodiesterase
MRSIARLLACAVSIASVPLLAQPAPTDAAQSMVEAKAPPKLLIAISVDQFSADLFNEYRPHFTGGLRRLQMGAVFPNAYHSHAATETCPGHSTLLTGNRPGHTGIVANEWIDQSVAREDKVIYCSEDPSVSGSSSRSYTTSNMNLRVPAMGEYMKAANPAAKVISVAGKDRAAIMMGGKTPDQIWWWGGDGFVSYKGTVPTPLIERVNSGIRVTLNQDRPAMELPELCEAVDRAVPVSDTMNVGDGRFARKAGDQRAFRTSPEADAAVLALAATYVDEEKLGTGPATDLLIVGLSATDYVGHSYGGRGTEMCLQLLSLDQGLGAFFERLDNAGLDYMVTLTADHGGLDIPERLRAQAAWDAERVDTALYPAKVSEAITAKTGIVGNLILGTNPFGDMYVNSTLKPAERARVLAEAQKFYKEHKQVAAVFTKAEIAATPAPSGPPESWSLLTMAKASFDPERSGDLVVLLKPRIMPISHGVKGYVATHGSPWDYDRRVPLLFWRKDMTRMEQPRGVETVDILPTLAAQIGLTLPMDKIDGRCLDLNPSETSSCPAPQDR